MKTYVFIDIDTQIDFIHDLGNLAVPGAEALRDNLKALTDFALANKIKIIVWEKNGFWMLYKRVEKGRFQFPAKADHDIHLTSTQLSWLLSGISIHQNPSITSLSPTAFY